MNGQVCLKIRRGGECGSQIQIWMEFGIRFLLQEGKRERGEILMRWGPLAKENWRNESLRWDSCGHSRVESFYFLNYCRNFLISFELIGKVSIWIFHIKLLQILIYHKNLYLIL